MTSTVEDRLRTHYVRVADELELDALTFDDVLHRKDPIAVAPPTPGSRRPVTLALAAACALVLIAGLVAVNGRETADPPAPATEPATSPPQIPETVLPATTLATDADGVPISAPHDASQVPYGPLDFATTDSALPLWPDANSSEPVATTTGYGMSLCDSGYSTRVLRVDPAEGPAHAYAGTLCPFIDLATPRADAVTTCATTTVGFVYARCQRRTDLTDTVGVGTTVVTTADEQQQSAMRGFPTATRGEGVEPFTVDLDAVGGPEETADFQNEVVAVTITPAEVGDFVDTPGVCFSIVLEGATARGCVGNQLLATGLAYGAFRDGDRPIELIGIVPDEVTTIEVGGVTVVPTNNVWHHTLADGPAPRITARFEDGHNNATT